MLDKVRVIIFDWGGTIVRVARQTETCQPCVDAAIAWMRSAGIALPAEAADDLQRRIAEVMASHERLDDLREVVTGAMFQAWADAQGLVLPEGGFLGELVEAFWRPWVGCLDVLGNGLGTLRTLAARGYTIALVSNCAVSPACCRTELERLGLAPLLAFSLFSSELGVRKPHDEIYRRALAEARTAAPGLQANEVLFIGDTPAADVDGPARHGMKTALVRTGNWKGSTDELTRQPDLILGSIDELPAVLPARGAPPVDATSST